MLTSEAVVAVMNDCMYEDVDSVLENGMLAPEAIVHRYVLNGEKLETHRNEVIGWINELPKEFLKDGGGGWSFLNLCMKADGTQWTGLHLIMEQLVVLAEGLGLAEIQLPREMWSVLPGGVPYIVFNTEGESN